MSLKLYKDSNDVYWIGNSQFAPGSLRFDWTIDRLKMRVPGWSELENFDYYLKENGDPYSSFDELNLAFSGFFLKGSLGNVIPIELTFLELITLIKNSNLTPGQSYEFEHITDYVIGNTDNILGAGVPEKIIVKAISKNTIEKTALSKDYPQDTLYYNYLWQYVEDLNTFLDGEWGDGSDGGGSVTILSTTTDSFTINTNPIIGLRFNMTCEDSSGSFSANGKEAGLKFTVNDNGNGTYTITLIDANIDLTDPAYNYIEISFRASLKLRTGWIDRRIDNILNIDIEQDYRNIKSRFGVPDWSSRGYNSLTSYSKRVLVEYNSVIYISIANSNIGNAPDLTPDFWQPLDGMLYNQPVASNINNIYGLPAYGAVFYDNYIIGTKCSDIKIKGNIYNEVINLVFKSSAYFINIGYAINGYFRDSCTNFEANIFENNIFFSSIASIQLSEIKNNILVRSFSYILGYSVLFLDNTMNSNVDSLNLKGEVKRNISIGNIDVCDLTNFQDNIILKSFSRNNIPDIITGTIFKEDFIYNQVFAYMSNCIFSGVVEYTQIKCRLLFIDFSAATLIYSIFNKEILTNSSGENKITYIDNLGTLIVSDILT